MVPRLRRLIDSRLGGLTCEMKDLIVLDIIVAIEARRKTEG